MLLFAIVMENRKAQYKMENNDIIKLEDFGIDNIFIDEKSHENILIYDISYKTVIDSNLCILDSIK